MYRVIGSFMCLLIALGVTSCEEFFDFGDDDDDDLVVDQAQATAEPQADDSTNAAPASANSVPSDFAGVKWLHSNVSGWEQTASLSAYVSGSSMIVSSSKAHSWPSRVVDGTEVNANPWIFVFLDGSWYAATWEWLRPGQTSKSVSAVNGDHIKKSPLSSWSPKSGEVYGFMVSGLARTSTRNVKERSNVVMVLWP